MSRTYKDKPSKLRFDLYMKDWILVEHDGFRKYRPGKTTKTKKRKEVDTENHWMSTPSWWTRMTMNKPQRRSVSLWEQQLRNLDTSKYNPAYDGTYPYEDLDLFDKPSKRVAHIYYW